MFHAVNEYSAHCHQKMREMGWWDSPRENGTLIALMHSELSEAMEADRKNLNDDKLPHRKGLEVELADLLLRVFDFAGYNGLDLSGALAEKFDYNLSRSDHKRENRALPNGKKY